jgi:hypothetical protein
MSAPAFLDAAPAPRLSLAPTRAGYMLRIGVLRYHSRDLAPLARVMLGHVEGDTSRTPQLAAYLAAFFHDHPTGFLALTPGRVRAEVNRQLYKETQRCRAAGSPRRATA